MIVSGGAGDLRFCSLYHMLGIYFVWIPTSLTAQADSLLSVERRVATTLLKIWWELLPVQMGFLTDPLVLGNTERVD